jgi:hypothetical protein
VSVPSNSIGSNARLTLTAPDGTKVLNAVSASSGSWVLPSTQAGTYTLFLNPSGNSTGTVSVQLQTTT